MAKSKKSKSGLSKGVRRFTVFQDRPGSSTSTRVTSQLFSHGALVKEKAATQQRINLALSGTFFQNMFYYRCMKISRL